MQVTGILAQGSEMPAAVLALHAEDNVVRVEHVGNSVGRLGSPAQHESDYIPSHTRNLRERI